MTVGQYSTLTITIIRANSNAYSNVIRIGVGLGYYIIGVGQHDTTIGFWADIEVHQSIKYTQRDTVLNTNVQGIYFMPRNIFAFLLLVVISSFQSLLNAQTASSAPEWIDGATAVQDEAQDVHWFDALSVGLEGQGWSEVEHPYDRLPSKANGLVSRSVWGLSHNSAGLAVHFFSNSPVISARWSLRKETLGMHHMPPTGVSGLDLYVKDGDEWRWASFGSPEQKDENVATLIGDAPAGVHEYLLNLPLYNGTEKLEIGIATGSSIAPAAYLNEMPLVFYGTSITQGGTVSRTGMAYPAILGREFQRETINLGFSGNGRMELEMADLLAELDAAVYVLDCLPNMDADLIRERYTPFILRLREAKPVTPIILVENIVYQGGWFSPSRARDIPRNDAVREEFKRLEGLGVTYLSVVEGAHLLGSDGLGTVDGTHPNDLGMLRIAEEMAPAIRAVLEP